jgi:AcrR family transcriptional regulator
MANATFFNLSKERQAEILEIAMNEFVQHSYEAASLNRIIEKCGVGKGSFYRYFRDKQELYQDLIQYARTNSVGNFEKVFENPVDDIFTAWKDFYFRVYEFDREKPLYTGFLFLCSYSRDRKETYLLRQKNRAHMVEKIKNTLLLYQTRNLIDQLIDPEFVAYVLLGIHDDVLNYIAFRFHIDFHDRASNHLPLFSMSKRELEAVLDSYVYFLKKGIGMI